LQSVNIQEKEPLSQGLSRPNGGTHRKNIYKKLEVNNVSQMTQKITELNAM